MSICMNVRSVKRDRILHQEWDKRRIINTEIIVVGLCLNMKMVLVRVWVWPVISSPYSLRGRYGMEDGFSRICPRNNRACHICGWQTWR